MSTNVSHHGDTPELLTFSEAARLSGQPKAYLKELAGAGRLAVRLLPGDGEPKLRLTRGSLSEAGLLSSESVAVRHDRDELSALIALIREQADRITALEELRFQLGAQLGAAIERVSSLEETVSTLKPLPPPGDVIVQAITAAESEVTPTKSVDAARPLLELGTRGLRRSGELRDRYLPRRFRLPRGSREQR